MSVCDDCKKGFNWSGKPEGKETKLGDNDAYVTGTSKSAAILFIHDILGWKFTNSRLLADHFAKEANATVYIPDYFGGEVVSESIISDPEKFAAFDIKAFVGRQNKDLRFPEILANAKSLKKNFPKVGAVGYCYGAWACFQLGADTELIDTIVVAHASLLTKEEIDGIKVPVQIHAPEHDQAYTQELKDYSNSVIPTKGVPYEYVYYPGISHGFATKGDPNNKTQVDALERAQRGTVNFFNEFLH